MTDHYQHDGLKRVEKPDFCLVVGAALVIILVCLLLNVLGLWEHRTFNEIWMSPSETTDG